MRRLRQFQGVRLVASGPKTDEVDRWLQRISNLSQVILVAVAIFTVFYTVIPFYTKATLEEDVAAKRLELKRVEGALRDTYSNLRNYVRNEIVASMVQECAFGPPDVLLGPGKFANLWDKQVLALDRRKCIAAVVERSNISMLRAHDAKTIIREIDLATKEGDAILIKANVQYVEVAEAARISPR